MRTEIGNLWYLPADARCITTNGSVRSDVTCPMGRGVARQARLRYPGVDAYLGLLIKDHGNVPHILLQHIKEGGFLVSFPVKHAWYEAADPILIEQSATLLMEMIEAEGWKRVLLPRPGCGNGRLTWDEVRPVIRPILDRRVIVITNK